MGGTGTTPSCSNCQRLQAQLDALQAQFESQQAQLKTLQVAFAQLQAQLAAARKNSSTSSKPPSSDIVKPPKPPPPEGQDKRRIGGQPGHPKHERALFPPEQVNGGSHDYVLDLCPGCGHGLQPAAAAPRVVQQIEIHEVPLLIEEHCSHPGWCPHCQKLRYASFPLTIERGGLVGPRLTTLIAYLKGPCHASSSTIRKFLRDVVQVTISRGPLAKIIAKVSEALEQP